MENEIERFDVLEFRILNASSSGCYSLDKESSERAKLLMRLGIFEENPESNWWKSGWTLTEKGKEYFYQFLETLRKRHGHIWKTRRDNDPESYRDDGDDLYANSLDQFAYESGYHNGYVCKKCGYHFCVHCTPEFEVQKCNMGGKQ